MHKFFLAMHDYDDDSMRVIVADDENNNFHLQKSYVRRKTHIETRNGRQYFTAPISVVR